MTRLLASVTNRLEAEIALRANVDFIDLKNPMEGALGALPLSVVSEIVSLVDGQKPVSATVGDLPMNPEVLIQAAEAMYGAGVDIVKVGFFGHVAHRECVASMQPLISMGLKMVAVLFADQKPDFALIPELADAGFYGVMLDTAEKTSGSLTSQLTMVALDAFVASARRVKLVSGLAGSLRVEDISTLHALQADYIGFRGALCANADRVSHIDEMRLFAVKAMLHNCNSHPLALDA